MVLEAGSCGGLLAVSGVWSFCRCKGLYYTGKDQRGEKNVKILTMQKQHSLEIPDCLDEESSTSCLRRECVLGGKSRECLKGVCLKDNQFVFDKFFFFFLSLLKPSLRHLDYLKDDL